MGNIKPIRTEADYEAPIVAPVHHGHLRLGAGERLDRGIVLLRLRRRAAIAGVPRNDQLMSAPALQPHPHAAGE